MPVLGTPTMKKLGRRLSLDLYDHIDNPNPTQSNCFDGLTCIRYYCNFSDIAPQPFAAYFPYDTRTGQDTADRRKVRPNVGRINYSGRRNALVTTISVLF